MKNGNCENPLKSQKQYVCMQIRHLLAFVCLCTVLCMVMQPVAATDNATAYYNLGEQLIAQGEYTRAIEAFDKALASNTTMIEKSGAIVYLFSDKAGALIDIGKYNDAISTADQGLAIDSKYRGLWSNKGYALYKLGKYQEALIAIDRAITIDSSIPKDWIHKGDALRELGRYQDAVDAYNKALSLDPGNTDATEHLIRAQEKVRAQEKASAISPVEILAVIALVAVIGGATYYLIKRKAPSESSEGKTGKKK